jgi:iron complex transport system substrate-binding protein
LVVLLAACSSGGRTDVASTTAGPTTVGTATVTTVSEPAATVSDAAGGFPVTVTHDLGELVLDGPPQRIASLSPTTTETLYAIGAADQIVATDLFSDWPPEAAETPKLDAFNFNVEEVASHEPDLVLLAFDFQGESAALGGLGIPTVVLGDAKTLDEVYEQIRTLGAATGHPAEADRVVADMEAAIAEIVASTSRADGTSLYYEADTFSGYYSADSSTLIGSLFAMFGLDNIADRIGSDDGTGFMALTEEFILEQDPDIIFLGSGEAPETVGARPGWDTLGAVQSDAIAVIDNALSGRWGPRTVELAGQIASGVERLVG